MLSRGPGLWPAQHDLNIRPSVPRRAVMGGGVVAPFVQVETANVQPLVVDHRDLLVVRNRVQLRKQMPVETNGLKTPLNGRGLAEALLFPAQNSW